MAEDVDLDDEPLSPPTPSCRVVAAPPVGERILVKHPLGAHPIEMWITVPDLDVRPPEVVACFCAQLRVTAAAGSRRVLDASKLMLVDGGGDTLSVSASLRASRVRYGDALVLLPSLRRLRFLRAELASRVADRAAQESDMPNFKGSDLGRFPVVSADFWTSDHLSERSRSVDAVFERARAEHSR